MLLGAAPPSRWQHDISRELVYFLAFDGLDIVHERVEYRAFVSIEGAGIGVQLCDYFIDFRPNCQIDLENPFHDLFEL
jgi:hypothetical protein